jgi:hypothetical protein
MQTDTSLDGLYPAAVAADFYNICNNLIRTNLILFDACAFRFRQ